MTTATPHCTFWVALRRRLRRETGQSLVEFAVVLPVFIALILGILYFSRYENYSNQETQVAEQGVRWAAINVNPGSPSQTLQQYIQSQASPELASGSGDVTALKVYIYNPSGQATSVRVCVTTTATSPVGLASFPIAESASMHIEQSNPPAAWTANAPPVSSPCPA